jgi:hypothetical protein
MCLSFFFYYFWSSLSHTEYGVFFFLSWPSAVLQCECSQLTHSWFTSLFDTWMLNYLSLGNFFLRVLINFFCGYSGVALCGSLISSPRYVNQCAYLSLTEMWVLPSTVFYLYSVSNIRFDISAKVSVTSYLLYTETWYFVLYCLYFHAWSSHWITAHSPAPLISTIVSYPPPTHCLPYVRFPKAPSLYTFTLKIQSAMFAESVDNYQHSAWPIPKT